MLDQRLPELFPLFSLVYPMTFPLTFILWEQPKGRPAKRTRARNGGEKKKEGWENDSEMLRSPPLRRVCERTVRTIHCSRAEWRAAREGEERGEGREERGEGRVERGRQNRHSLLLLVPTAWLGQKSGAGVWIQDCSFAERLGRTDGELWREWVRDEGEEQEQEAFFFVHCTEQTLPLFQCHSNRPRRFYSPRPRSATVKFITILQPLLCPYLQCRSG